MIWSDFIEYPTFETVIKVSDYWEYRFKERLSGHLSVMTETFNLITSVADSRY